MARAILFRFSIVVLPSDGIRLPSEIDELSEFSSGALSRNRTTGSVRANMYLVLLALTKRPSSFAASTTLFCRDCA